MLSAIDKNYYNSLIYGLRLAVDNEIPLIAFNALASEIDVDDLELTSVISSLVASSNGGVKVEFPNGDLFEYNKETERFVYVPDDDE